MNFFGIFFWIHLVGVITISSILLFTKSEGAINEKVLPLLTVNSYDSDILTYYVRKERSTNLLHRKRRSNGEVPQSLQENITSPELDRSVPQTAQENITSPEKDSWESYVETVYKDAFSPEKKHEPHYNPLPGMLSKRTRIALPQSHADSGTKTETNGTIEPYNFKKTSRTDLKSYSFVFDPTNRNEECRCGTNGVIHLRVVGGTDAELNEFPWQVGLFTWNRGLFCGGSLINSRFVLTAAHCVVNKTQDVIKAILADHDLTTNMESKSKSIKVEEIILYPEYTRSIYTNDIAILKLATEVKFSDTIRPPCFPPPGTDHSAGLTIVTGWGATEEGEPSHPILQKASLPVIDLEKCKEAYGDIVTDSVMCVGGIAGRDACQGDSGGPLVKTDSVRHFLIGVVSWGSGCGNADLPGVYTKVDHFYDWIYETTKEGKYCK